MASGFVRFGDLQIATEVFATDVAERQLQNSAIVRSGAVRLDPLFSNAADEAEQVRVRSYKPMDRPSTDVPFTGSDNLGAAAITPFKVEQQAEQNHTIHRQGVWAESDLAAELARTDPLGYVRSRVSSYWDDYLQSIIHAQIKGVIADNVANDSADMIHDISGAANTAASGTTKFGKSAFLAALQSRGDKGQEFAAVYMHSSVFWPAVDADVISTVVPSDYEGSLLARGFYMGRPVFVDDDLPSGTDALVGSTGSAENGVYSTYILGPGAFSFGRGSRRVPVEVHRAPLAANASAGEYLINRINWVVHPQGMTLTSTALSGAPQGSGPTHTTFETAASWNRVRNRKNVGITVLTTRET